MSAGSKSRLAKAAGAEVAAQGRQEKWHAAVARSTFQVKMYKTPRLRSSFGSSDVQKWHAAMARSTLSKNITCSDIFGPSDLEKWHAAVARSTLSSQHAKNMTCSGHFWAFRSRKMARRCGAKHIVKSTC